MKKSWVLLLFLAAALFFSCSAALASPIDGTWKIVDGYKILFQELIDPLNPSTVNPSEFKIRVEQDDGLYNIVFNGGDGVKWRWMSSESEELKRLNGLTKGSEEYYSFTDGTISISVSLLDDSTLQVRNGSGKNHLGQPLGYHITFERVPDEEDEDENKVEDEKEAKDDDDGRTKGGECGNTGVGMLGALVFLLPVVFATKRRK